MLRGVLWGGVLDDLGVEGDPLGEKTWILRLGKGPPRTPAAREAVATTPRPRGVVWGSVLGQNTTPIDG